MALGPINSITLIVRFASAVPDIEVRVSSPTTTSIRALKCEIRPNLPPEWKDHGLKLIYGGRVLKENDSVALALRSSRSNHGQGADEDQEIGKTGGKGKGRAQPEPEQAPVYIHCALSNSPLSTSALALEAAPTPELLPNPTSPTERLDNAAPSQQHVHSYQPVGFDRLLSTAGFTAADVVSLRAQYRAMIASRHTPDTMPTPRTLLAMEERWLEASSGPLSALPALNLNDGAQGQPTSLVEDEDDTSGQLDDTLYGIVMGFLWPLGAAAWGLREEGVWSRRRGMAVLMGVCVNFGMAFLRMIN